ncbi:MAG: PTS system mannose/fructose/sorbose family transporter subunit IID, partial [Longicatena sp.]
MKSNVAKHLDSSDIKKVFWRAFLLPSCYSMDIMQAPGFAYSMIPVLEKLYSDDKEKLAEACSRHSEVYNNTFAMSPLVLGISSAMEEEAANNEEFDVSSINNIKVALMGPLAGIGDTFFWGTFRIIGSGIGISLAQQGSILGPLLFLLIYNIPHILVRIYGIKLGYKFGGKSIEAISAGGLMNKATRAAT